ncbi:hypothetical protein ABTX15_04370 [Micromonospora sp. NPDC094482]|uniref:hypothetical protein n=1 Tax=unclassified Micromonospora TaxID=2617518 RepID=UPI003320E7AA
MARRGWGGSIATAVGVAAGTGAAQLGFGYGLGIINWAPADSGAAPAAWVASLIWATWIAATSTVLGAVCAHRLHERSAVPAATDGIRSAPDAPGEAPLDPSGRDVLPVDEAGKHPRPAAAPVADTTRGGGLWHVGLAVAAGLGALITVLLVAVPARVAAAPDTATPQRVAAGYAAIGVLLGVLAALWALRSRAAATNMIATVAWLWLLAVVAVVDGVLSGRGLASAQLGIWQISSDRPGFWIRDYLYWPGALLSLGSALVIGVLAARRAARSAQRRVGATTSGAAGPLLVAVGYLLAVPRLSAISPEQVSAHLIAPYAVIVGMGGSVLLATLAQRADRRSATRSQPVAEPAAAVTDPTPPAGPDAGEAEPSTGQLGPGAAEKTAATPGRSGDGDQPAAVPSVAPAGVPRVPAPRTGEADRLDPVGADDAAPGLTPPKPAGRRSRPPRRTS